MTTIDIINKVCRVCEIYQKRSKNGFDFPCLGEMCAVASAFLTKKLRDHRRKANLIVGQFEGDEHCWVEYHNKIYDITASQFGKPRIHIVKASNIDYDKEVIIDGMDKYRIKKEFDDWDYYQRPTRRTMRKLETIWRNL